MPVPQPEVHPTAIVHPEAQIGEGTRVSPFVVIEKDVVIGRNCRIRSHAVIKQFTRMGDDNQIFEGVVLGGLPQDLKHQGGRSGLEIGDGNVFRENVTVNRSTSTDGVTRLGNHNFLMTGSHVAHECVLEDRVVMANCVALAGHVTVESHAFLSGGVVVHQFSQVGRCAMAGGNAKVTQDVLPFFLVDGVPARTRALNLVGLRRADFTQSEIRALKAAFRILTKDSTSLQDKLGLLDAIESPHVRHLAGFIRRSSRGFCSFRKE